MNDKCPFCDEHWQQGDRAMVIGMIHADHTGGLAFVHRECIMRETLGDETTSLIIARERGEG